MRLMPLLLAVAVAVEGLADKVFSDIAATGYNTPKTPEPEGIRSIAKRICP